MSYGGVYGSTNVYTRILVLCLYSYNTLVFELSRQLAPGRRDDAVGLTAFVFRSGSWPPPESVSWWRDVAWRSAAGGSRFFIFAFVASGYSDDWRDGVRVEQI